MVCNNRGMALVSVLLILTVLLILAHILAEKVWQSTRQAAAAASRAQLFWAAQGGIEDARRRLAAGYAGSGGWRDFLAHGSGQNYPAVPVWTSVIHDLPVEIYLRDNLDGDDDVQHDNDLKVFVLVRARGAQGEGTMIECLCGLAPLIEAGALPQRGQEGAGIGFSGVPVSSYGVDN